METNLSLRGLKTVSNIVISLFAVVSLLFFLLSIDRTLIIIILSIVILGASMYLMWFQREFDSISLLTFFFGTTACFFFFSDQVIAGWPRAAAVAVFALLSLALSNYLINTIKTTENKSKTALYKISLAIIFTEVFWILSFLQSSPISKGVITAIVFFNLETIVRDILKKNLVWGRVAFLILASIILLAVVIYRI